MELLRCGAMASASVAGKVIKPKKRCCKDRPRCKRCPVVLKRLADADLAEHRDDKRFVIDPELRKKQLREARKR